MGRIFEGEPAVQVLDHLADGYGLFVNFEDRPAARAVEDLLKRLDQVDDIGGEFRLRALGVHELTDCRIAQHRVFNLLLLQKHLRCGFELFVLKQSIDKFVARVILRVWCSERIARQQHFRLDVDQHRRHVDELGGNVHVEFAYALDISEVLRRDPGNGDVVNVDVLLADQVEQQVERSFINFAKRDGEREIAASSLPGLVAAELLSRAAELLSRAWETALSRRDAACRVSAGTIRASSRREASTGSCSDTR